jgi:YD repeat-containing protein
MMRSVLATLLAALSLLVLGVASSSAAVACPNGNPVVNENQCMGAGTTAFEMTNYSETLGGYSTQTSFNLGQSVPLKIARDMIGTRVDIAVYRTGYYGDTGGRLIPAASATNVLVNNTLACNAEDPTTGLRSCGNWGVTYTIPAASLPATGVYVAKLTSTDASHVQNQIVFTIRDDNRAVPSQALLIVPTNTYEAYNNWGGKSAYYDKAGGATTVSGSDRAVKLSFDRPLDAAEASRNRYFGPDHTLVSWLERQGYDVSYTDDVQVARAPSQLLQHRVVIISGHSEYWSGGMLAAVKAARDAGVSVSSFSANTAYWKVRYENAERTMVTYKTVQGSGSNGSGAVGANDAGPDGVAGTADDALGADGVAGTSDDNPANATTTFRDAGAPAGDPNAPPGGRVGPNTPENGLFGAMYFGDHESNSYPLTIPPSNAAGEFAGDRLWRNTGIATNTTTTIGTNVVGWEWDSVPTQPQYLLAQPAGVKRVSATPTTDPDTNWLQDQGRVYANTPPPGQPAAAHAVRYKAPSGATVFAAGTNQWAYGLDDDRLAQATYNVLSDMKIQPLTPDATLTLDPAGANQAPNASFTIAPNPGRTGQTVTFDGSSSTDADGTITKYEWDLDGNGTFETNTGTTKTATRTYAAEATIDVHLRVTDNSTNTDSTTRTLTVIVSQPPVASFTATPNPAVIGQPVAFDGTASSDPDGTVVKWEWDLDGNGTYETNTGTTKTTTKTFAASGTVNVGLRVTDNSNKTATATVPVTINSSGVSNYGDAVNDTAGLTHYWRMGEATGPTLADGKGTAHATVTGGTFAVPGGPLGDPNTAVRFNGSSDSARTAVDLSGTSKLTVEFWLKWNAYSNNDQLAMELTSNFNDNDGGLLVDPNAPQLGGTFGVGMGRFGARNNVFFARPTAGVWHHYALVLDATAPGASQITPYVDGQPVTYTKIDSGTGGGPFANSTLYLMSRAGTTLFGAGDLDELALYDRTLSAATVADHAASQGTNRRPKAAFSAPANATVGQTVTLDATASSDLDGTITKYEWDLDGNGSYEVNGGTTKTRNVTLNTAGDATVGLRVTDDRFAMDTETQVIHVANGAPTASFTAAPNPAVVGQPVAFDATASSDPNGTITKYEWDLDGNGSYETDTGTTKTTTRTYTAPGTVNVGLRVTDNSANPATTTVPVTVNAGGVSNYGDAVTDTAGLMHYWRMGEAAGPTLADGVTTAPANATVTGGTFGVPGGPAGDPNTAVRFNGSSDSASTAVDLSSTSKLTVEFWLKWNAYANDDALAMELTSNFNDNNGGLLVDPNAPQSGGTFGVALGRFGARNNVFFARPSAGAWHHYALVLDTTAPGASQITPYVDGQPVTYTKTDSGTGAGPFANSTLYLMSRAGTALRGAGDLDELAIYNRTLSAATIADHASSSGTNRRPKAAFTAPATATAGQAVQLDASGSSDPDGSITKYEWDLDGNGSYETNGGTTATRSVTFPSAGDVTVGLRVTDDRFATDTETKDVHVITGAPTASFTVTPNPAPVGASVTFDASASSDPDGSIAHYEWDLDGNGSYETDGAASPTTTHSYDAAATVPVGLRVTDNATNTATASKDVTVRAASSYAATVNATPGLISAWRMDALTGTLLGDSKGSSPAGLSGGATLGVPGALAGDPNTAVRFDGANDFASADLNLSSTSAITVEMWLKWDAFSSNDDLAFELTPNFNDNDGGFLVDPNAGGSFGIGLGRSASRNTAYFDRPSAGVWHHYVFVLDATAPAATQITPYVDGQPVPYTKGNLGTGAGPFAHALLYFMSRGGTGLFGAGDLDEVAIYDRALAPATIAEHYTAGT